MAKPATLTRRSSAPALPPGQLPPRSTTWRAQSGLLAAAGLGGLGAAPLVGHPGLAVPAAVCGAGAGVGRYWLGTRDDRRHQLVDQLVEALTQPLGMTRPSRAAVRARAWTRRSPGHPRKVTVRYSPRVDDTDPAWRAEIVAIVSRRLLVDYELRSHDRRRCLLHLVPARPLEDGPATPALLQRAQQSATELFGPTASVADPQWREEELVGFTVRHSIGAKLAAAGYRRRIEQVVTAMLPGRWRAAWDLENDTATFTVRPSFPASVWLPVRDIDTSADLLASYDSVEIPYGVDEDGELMVWRPAHDPNVMAVGSPGSGKALALDTPVPTPTGWTTMGALTAGDVVFDEAGATCTVLAAHAVRHDRPCYRVQFSDGSSVVADAEHLWWTSTKPERTATQRSRIRDARTEWRTRMTTEQLAHLTELLDATDPAAVASLPSLARLIGVSPAERYLRTAAAPLPAAGPDRIVEPGLNAQPARIYNQRDLLEGVIRWGSTRLRGDKPRMPEGQVRTTREIAVTVRYGGDQQLNHAIPVVAALQLPDADLPIDPYVLGVWLGDGHGWGAGYTSVDPGVAVEIESRGYQVIDHGVPRSQVPGYTAHDVHICGIRRALDDLDLIRISRPGKRDRVKHIPPQFLRGSEAQRRDLLAGLMDTDGTVAPRGTCQFTNTSRALALGTHELACSLGYRATIQEGRARLNGRDCGPKWTVAWTTDDEIFRLERKRLVHKQRTARFTPARNLHRHITAVEPVPSVPVRCITVDSPSHLYLVGEAFIPTHNTVLDHTILVEATRHGWPVWVVDGKSIEFLGFQDWPNVQIVATTVAQQVAVIHRAWEVMEHRYDLITSGRATEQDFEPLLVFLDEFADFRSNLMAWYAEIKIKGDPTKPLVLSRVASIARKGRTSRVHLVFTTQRPDAEYFGGDMRDNFRMRVSMGRLSPQGAMMMWESPVVGVSIPRGCRGRATTVNDANRAVEIQTYRTPDPRKAVDGSDEAELLEQLRPTEARHERLLIVDPWDDVTDRDLDTGEIIDPTYREYAGARWVLARDRPDLDPVAHRTAPSTSGRELSSPMTVFGLTETAGTSGPAVPLAEPPADARPPAVPVVSAGLRAVPDLPSEDEVDVDEYYGYGPTSTTPAGRIKAGDLVLIDEESGQWAVVDADPEDDVADPGCIALSWRGDADEAGYLSVPADDLIAVRRPLEENQ